MKETQNWQSDYNSWLENTFLPTANLPDNQAAADAIGSWLQSKTVRHFLAGFHAASAARQTQSQFAAQLNPVWPPVNEKLEQLHHVIDYVAAALTSADLAEQYKIKPESLRGMNYDALARKAEQWNKWLAKQPLTGLDDSDFTVTQSWPDGWRLIELLTPKALDNESSQMGHCIGGGSYDGRLNGKNGYRQYSLRDPSGQSHVTLEVCNGTIKQAQGKQNKPIIAAYLPQVARVIIAQQFKSELKNSAEKLGVVYNKKEDAYSIFNLPEIFEGDFKLENAPIFSLGKLKSIEGNAEFTNSHFTNLGHLQFIGGSANFRWSQVTDLGQLQAIGGNANFMDSKISSLGQLRSIGADANFRWSKINNLGYLQSIGGDVDFRHSQITNLGHLQSIGGNIKVGESEIADLHKFLSRTEIAVKPVRIAHIVEKIRFFKKSLSPN